MASSDSSEEITDTNIPTSTEKKKKKGKERIIVQASAFLNPVAKAYATLNGELESITPGVPHTYIPEANYVQLIENPIEFLIANFKALGSTLDAAYGAHIRLGLRAHFKAGRESAFPGADYITQADADAYMALHTDNHSAFAVIQANAASFVGMCAATFYRTGHHVDFNNPRPYIALVQSLGLEINVNRMFLDIACYKAVHPIPTEHLFSIVNDAAHDRLTGVSPAVMLRLKTLPAGTGGLGPAYAALQIMAADTRMKQVCKSQQEDIAKLTAKVEDIRRDPVAYHQMAPLAKVPVKPVNLSEYIAAITIGRAYAEATKHPTLSKSPSLAKYGNGPSYVFFKVFFKAAVKSSDEMVRKVIDERMSDDMKGNALAILSSSKPTNI